MPIPLQLNISNVDYHHQICEDLLPPSSPVSSSYSELRHVNENYQPPMAPIYPSTSHLHNHTYANIYHLDYHYATYQSCSHQAQVWYRSNLLPIPRRFLTNSSYLNLTFFSVLATNKRHHHHTNQSTSRSVHVHPVNYRIDQIIPITHRPPQRYRI